MQKKTRMVLQIAVVAILAAMLSGTSALGANTDTNVKEAAVAVKGLSCTVCAQRLQKVLAKLPGAQRAEVQLEKGKAIIDFNPATKVTDNQIQQTVRDAGFVPGKIEWRRTERRGGLS